MKRLNHSRKEQRGFTLLELVVVISVLVALAALLVPALDSVMDDAKVAETATLYDTLKKACTQHYLDTSRYAHEYTGARYVQPNHHELAQEQTYAGWRGPYLEDSLGTENNPWKGNIHLYNYLLVNGLPGWDLDRDGNYEFTTQDRACVLWMTSVSEASAEALDEAMDRGDLGSGVDWRQAGRLQWSSASGGTIWMLVFRNS